MPPTKDQPSLCYMCVAPAVTTEHVPARVFFPEDKDLPVGMQPQRKNLITVPSCRRHNNACSEDDEYAAYIVRSYVGVNDVASTALWKKTLRAYRRQPGKAAWEFNTSRRVMRRGDHVLPGSRVDAERLDRVFIRIARGLFFRDFGERLQIAMRTLCVDLIDAKSNALNPTFVWFDSAFAPFLQQGRSDNPETFRYQFFRGPAKPVAVYRLVFFGGFRVIVVPKFRGDMMSE